MTMPTLNELSISIPETSLKRVVIVGGGFGGIEFAKLLSDKDFQVVLIDRHNYHTFQPLLYQVATAGLEADSIAAPLRQMFEEKKNFHFRMAMVNEVRPEQNTICTSIGNLNYNVLVLAVGSKSNYFGNQELPKTSFRSSKCRKPWICAAMCCKISSGPWFPTIRRNAKGC